MDALGINLGYILVQILNFAIMLIVLRAWVYEPLINMMAKRKASIEQGLEDARVAAQARANAEKEAEKVLLDAQTKAGEIVAEARTRADAQARDIKADAEADALKIKADAQTGLEQERSRILGDLRGQVAAISMAATQKLVGEALDQKRQQALLQEFFSGVKSGKVVVLEGAALKGTSAEVTSALALSDEEKETVKSQVLAKAGDLAEVTFREDPAILGGLVIQVGDKVLDGSVAGKLNAMRESLQ